MARQRRQPVPRQVLAAVLLLFLAAIVGSTLGREWPATLLSIALVVVAVILMIRFYRRSRAK